MSKIFPFPSENLPFYGFTDVIIRSDSALNKDMKRLHTFIGYLAKAGWTKKIIHFDSFFRIYAIKKKNKNFVTKFISER